MRFGPGTSVSQLPPSTTADVLRALDQLQATARGIADAPEHHDVASLAELTEQVMDNLRPLVVLWASCTSRRCWGRSDRCRS
jgi:hypothetical protein